MATITDEPDEILDLVDDQDRVIGTVSRGTVAEKMLALPGNVRAADVFLVNQNGQIWVPRRSMHKKSAPGGLDFSAGEHVKSGETYIQAMIRGIREELNLDVTSDQLQAIGTIDWRNRNLFPYFETIFVYHTDTEPDYNKDDFVSGEWRTPEEFLHKLQSGEPAKKNLQGGLELYIQNKKG